MKGLDTSALLALLEGDLSVRDLLRRLRGVEFATTEANLLELTVIAHRGSTRSRRPRRDALERLRKKITVLPIDSRAVEQVDRHLQREGAVPPPLFLAMLGSLEAAGCDELFTREPVPGAGKWKLRITRIGRSHTK
jgi:predicted nucleic acid-binding protein